MTSGSNVFRCRCELSSPTTHHLVAVGRPPPYLAALFSCRIQEPDDAVIKVELAGLCGSDLHAYRGKVPFDQPYVDILRLMLPSMTLSASRFVMGHEVYGTIVRLGTSFAHTSEKPNSGELRYTGASKGWGAPRAYMDLEVGDQV